MKPVSVRFKCFGPYMDEQFIDFSELEKNGLFLICGETGAGKTTILDAICYALYCESSGGLRGDIENMRCKLAEKSEETLVEFIFDSNGRRYKFSRAMKFKTKNLHKYHNSYVLNGETWEVLDSDMKSVTARAEKLVGLTSGQFRQVIILPQGKFEEFLVSDSKKKEEILVTLFNVQQWSKISEEISRRVNARAAELNQEKIAIAEGLRRYGCDSLEALEGKRVQLEAELEMLIPRAKNAETEENQAREQLQAQLQVAKAYDELAKRQKKMDELDGREASIRSQEESLSLADRAEQAREPYETYRNLRREKLRAEEQLRRSEQQKKTAQDELEKANLRMEAHLARESAMQEKKAYLLRLENTRSVYENLQSLRSAVTAARKNYQQAEQVLREKQEDLEACDAALAEAFAEQERAKDAYTTAQIRYRRSIGGILAAGLEPGKPCPVCGSKEHPDPAKTGEDHVSEAQLDKLNKAMGKADKAVSTAIRARTQGEAARNEAQDAVNRAQQALTAAQTGCRSAEEQKLPGIETGAELNRAISAAKQELADWESAGKNLLEAQTGAQGACRGAELALEAAKQELNRTQVACASQTGLWEAARAEAGFASEMEFLAACLEPREKQRRREQVSAFRSDWKVAQAALLGQQKAVEGKPVRNLAAMEENLKQAEKTRKTLTQQQILMTSELKNLRSDGKKLTARLEASREALIRLEADQVFARRLSGSHGVGLQRYVLGVMMNSITTQANRLLENVYGGRYRLHRTDETTGRTLKGGLELEVSDSQNSQRRSVKTLSGGEKFLVALSLAIGLSTVVQAQGEGIRLEAMFIDEGFGSLDRESIQDALDILQSIRRTAGVVGIISHVEALAETVPAQIRITKGRNGSTCRLTGL